MKKRLKILIIALLSFLFVLFLIYLPVVFQEGNPLPVAYGIIQLSLTGDGYAKIGEDKFIVKASESDIQKFKDYLGQHDLVFADQLGAAYFLKDKNGKRYMAASRMYSSRFMIWDFSSSANQNPPLP